MDQKKLNLKKTDYRVCPNPLCGFEMNEPGSTVCENCHKPLNPTLIKQNLKVISKSNQGKGKNKNHKKRYILGAVGGIILLTGGAFVYHIEQVNANNPEFVLKRTKKLDILFGGEPCAQGFVQKQAAKEIEKLNKGIKFVYRDNDRNRDQVWEVINGGIDIAFTEQTLPKHYKEALEIGKELAVIDYADDLIAFVTNKDTQSRPLTVDELEDIYAGKITNWKDLDGEDREIIAIALEGEWRNPNGLRFSRGLGSNVLKVDSPEEGKRITARTKGAIFYTSATLAARELNKFNVIEIQKYDGAVISPVLGKNKTNLEALARGEYPLVRNLQIVVAHAVFATPEARLSPKQKAVKAFVRLLISPKGQRWVIERGFGARYPVAEETEEKFSFFNWL
ncbi:MAG: PstS family phosphate ABC transporter substrate-binding protein [Xenococcaceae cyanobacterium]